MTSVVTAVRNLERAGVPRSAAMAMIGHKTEVIYRRYAIVDEGILQEAATLLDAAPVTRVELGHKPDSMGLGWVRLPKNL